MAARTPAGDPAESPIRMNPAWAIEEYANIRFTSSWAMASTDPATTVTAATTASIGRHVVASGATATSNTRRNAANAATFVRAPMNAVTAVGAPCYAAGVHRRNVTSDTLN